MERRDPDRQPDLVGWPGRGDPRRDRRPRAVARRRRASTVCSTASAGRCCCSITRRARSASMLARTRVTAPEGARSSWVAGRNRAARRSMSSCSGGSTRSPEPLPTVARPSGSSPAASPGASTGAPVRSSRSPPSSLRVGRDGGSSLAGPGPPVRGRLDRRRQPRPGCGQRLGLGRLRGGRLRDGPLDGGRGGGRRWGRRGVDRSGRGRSEGRDRGRGGRRRGRREFPPGR